MADGIELAAAYVSIVPSTRGLGGALARDLGAAADQGGKQAGGRFRGLFRSGSKGAANDTQSAFGGAFKKIAAGAAGLFAGKKIFDGLVGTANTYKGLVADSAKLRRYVGGSLEDASRLRFVAQQTGIDSAKLGRSLGLFNKQLVSGKLDQFIGKTKDAHGNLLPLSQLLPRVADKFKNMANGPEKTALAMKLFGRAGVDMLPLLDKGSAGIKDLMKQSDKLGLTLGDKDVKAMKESNKNSRLWHASMQSLQLQIGRYVLPVLTKLTGWLASKMPAAIRFVRRVMEGLAAWWAVNGPGISAVARRVFGAVADAIGKVVAWVREHWPQIQAVVSAVMSAVSGVISTAVSVVQSLWSRFGSNIMRQVRTAWGYIRSTIRNAMQVIKGIIEVVTGLIHGKWGKVWRGIRDIFGGVFKQIGNIASTTMQTLWNVLNVWWSIIKDGWSKFWHGLGDGLSAIWDGILRTIGAAVNGIIDLLNKIHFTIKVPHIRGTNIGGDYTIGIPHIDHVHWGEHKAASGPATIAQHNPDAVVSGGRSRTRLARTGGGAVTVIAKGATAKDVTRSIMWETRAS